MQAYTQAYYSAIKKTFCQFLQHGLSHNGIIFSEMSEKGKYQMVSQLVEYRLIRAR